MKLKTVKIQHPKRDGHWLNINEIDYSPDVHQLWHDVVSPEVTHEVTQGDDDVIPHSSIHGYYTEHELNQIKTSTPNGWVKIRKIAISFGITEKPSGGWDEAIPLILEAQNNQNERTIYPE